MTLLQLAGARIKSPRLIFTVRQRQVRLIREPDTTAAWYWFTTVFITINAFTHDDARRASAYYLLFIGFSAMPYFIFSYNIIFAKVHLFLAFVD